MVLGNILNEQSQQCAKVYYFMVLLNGGCWGDTFGKITYWICTRNSTYTWIDFVVYNYVESLNMHFLHNFNCLGGLAAILVLLNSSYYNY